MRDWDKEHSDHEDKQAKADKKVENQQDAIRKLDGSAVCHPSELRLMKEMRGNKATLDFNRAMFDYDEEHKEEERKSRDCLPGAKRYDGGL